MHRSRAFTLVELAVVLVVIGLLTGGVLVGRDLIHASKLKSVISDINQYATAVNAFQVRYDELPGDMMNATAIWGAADDDPNTCITTESSGTLTCNGNGDGIMGEGYHAWKQLSNAGLVAGVFAGIAGTAGTQIIPGWNVPLSKINGAGFFFWGANIVDAGGPLFFGGKYGNAIWLLRGEPDPTFLGPVLSPNDAMNIDTKMDDAVPGNGSVRTLPKGSFIASAADCATTADVASAVYDLSSTEDECILMFDMGL